jgi:hypothetical protein
MAKRKKRIKARHPEDFQQLDEELTKALDRLTERNRETEMSLAEFASEEEESPPDQDDSLESSGQEEQTAQ